ncbi:MAG TPA: hypothetical protein VKY29_07315, partial [Cryomorphaceae bacterium]|nr:hypothetical protein [Cryomorphaceae bacterium]
MNLRKVTASLCLAAAVAMVSSPSASAQNDLPENFHFTELDNGLDLLVIEDPSVPLVTIEIAVHN